MNRLRKRSDAHSTVTQGSTPQRELPSDTLPEILTTNDFRTSLILPDLSRRFSLLRSSTSDPAVFDSHLRSRFAHQRARGAINQISEEEEEMLLNALGRIRIRPNAGDKSQEKFKGTAGIGAATGDYGSKEYGVTSTSLNASPRSVKRFSNSLFASGRLRDYTPVKNVDSSQSTTSSITTNASMKIPIESTSTSSLPSTSERTTPTKRNLNTVADTDEDETLHANDFSRDASELEHQLKSQLGPINLNRASVALQQVMKEIEDDLEEEILLPRTTPIPRGSLDQAMQDLRNSHSSRDSSVFEGGMAISIDKADHENAIDRGASPIPTRTVPGYVPGMPRPMTPRNIDFDDQRSISTTPRAQSPTVVEPLGNNSSKVRRDSTSSISKSVAIAPLFLQRSTNGRFTPTMSPTIASDEYQRDSELDNSPNYSAINRRRPASPLTGLPYQGLISNRPNSRPGTPSNVIWTPNSPVNGHGRRSSHSRNNSASTDTEMDYRGPLGSLNKPGGPRALRSPLPESLSPDTEQIVKAPLPINGKHKPTLANRSQGIIGEIDVAASISPPSSPPPRAVTPTQVAPRSPGSPSFAIKSTRLNPPSSPFNITAFGLSARANSSRSSLDSVGSSFHSWDEPDKVFSVFCDSSENQVLWHEFDDLDKSSSATLADESDPEDTLKRYGGLKKADIIAIQDKLVSAAFMKLANSDPRDRAPSALKRRRPSTSQSNYTRIASPPPQAQPPASPTQATNDDQYLKASALLNSVVESIKDQPPTLSLSPIARDPSLSSDEKETSPATRRNRALARALFGDEDTKEVGSPVKKAEPIKSDTEPESIVSTSSTSTTCIPSTPTTTTNVASTAPYVVPSPPISAQSSTSQTVEMNSLQRNFSVRKAPQSPEEQAELVREVQKKTEAAMIALNKHSSSTVNLPGGLSYSSSIRRRVDPKDISMPKLISATTNLDAVPLTKLSNNSTSKLSSHFRRLRGSLRVKNVVSSGEETVTPGKTSPTQAASIDSKASETSSKPSSFSGSPEQSRFKTPQSPVTSGPGLKGFMARFRNKQRLSGNPLLQQPSTPTTPTVLTTPAPASPRVVEPLTPTPSERSFNSGSRSPGQPRPMYSRFPPASQAAAKTSDPIAPKLELPIEIPPSKSPPVEQSKTALQLLFSAANDLGLDQNALTDLLSRSGSVSSQNLLNSDNSVVHTTSKLAPISNGAVPVSNASSTGSDQTATPTHPDTRPQVNSGAPEDLTTPKSYSDDTIRRPRELKTESNPVVRITRVYANDSPDLASLINRKSSRRKRASTSSISSRSVHDRAPTPPPPKGAKRFSTDRMPPVPFFPNGAGPPVASSASITNLLQSKHESLYDMYSGESRVVSMAVADEGQLPQEAHPALEVIELANGETVWNVVNGLRDGEESVYSRGSFVSESSTREAGSDGQKGQSRSDLRMSVSPLFSSTKKGQQGKNRPETKVYYSTSDQISRLIESLSQGADGGSVSIVPSFPSDRSSHSKSSSLSTTDMSWTLEERLEHMLGTMPAS